MPEILLYGNEDLRAGSVQLYDSFPSQESFNNWWEKRNKENPHFWGGLWYVVTICGTEHLTQNDFPQELKVERQKAVGCIRIFLKVDPLRDFYQEHHIAPCPSKGKSCIPL